MTDRDRIEQMIQECVDYAENLHDDFGEDAFDEATVAAMNLAERSGELVRLFQKIDPKDLAAR